MRIFDDPLFFFFFFFPNLPIALHYSSASPSNFNASYSFISYFLYCGRGICALMVLIKHILLKN